MPFPNLHNRKTMQARVSLADCVSTLYIVRYAHNVETNKETSHLPQRSLCQAQICTPRPTEKSKPISRPTTASDPAEQCQGFVPGI